MTNTARVSTRWVVAGAAIAGVAVAVGGLATGAALLDSDEGEPVTSERTETDRLGPASGASAPPSGPPSSTGEESSAGGATSPITVDVPRSERSTRSLHRPASPPAATSSTTAPAPITAPDLAAKAYLVAAESVTAADNGHRHHRADPLMAPGNPAIAAGILVSELLPSGHSRTIKVLALDERARNEDLGRIAYRVTYQRYVSPTIPAKAVVAEGAPRVTFVVVERQAGDDWLVLSQTRHLDPAA